MFKSANAIDLAPRERVADAAVERVRTILGEADDVRTRLDARQLAAQTGDAGADEHRPEPQRHPRIEPAIEQVERQWAGRDEEHPDPDRPVREPITDLVPFADRPVGGKLDASGVPERAFVGRGQQAAAREPGFVVFEGCNRQCGQRSPWQAGYHAP